MQMQLRDDQIKTLSEVYRAYTEGANEVCLQACTGFGKTVVASRIMHDAVNIRRKRVLFLAHRGELLTQASDKLQRFGVHHGLISPKHEPDYSAPCQVASIPALMSEGATLPPADLIIADECHRVDSIKIREKYLGSKILGLTATPCRLVGGKLNSLHGEYKALITSTPPEKLVQLGAICPLRWFSFPIPKLPEGEKEYDLTEISKIMRSDGIIADVVKTWMAAGTKKTIVFAVDIPHAEKLTEAFGRMGIEATTVTGSTNQEKRESILWRLAHGDLDVVINAALLIEGFDAPRVERIVLARPTRSLVVYLQSVGRGTRPGKPFCEVFDHAGLLFEHRHPYIERPWTLDQENIHQVKSKAESLWRCQNCFSVLMSVPEACPYCFEKVVHKGRKIKIVEGDLVEFDEIELARIAAIQKTQEDKESLIRADRNQKTRTLFAIAEKRYPSNKSIARQWAFRALSKWDAYKGDWQKFLREVNR